MDAVDVIVLVAEETICTVLKKVDFFSLLSEKEEKILLKNLFRKKQPGIFKSRCDTSSYQKSFP